MSLKGTSARYRSFGRDSELICWAVRRVIEATSSPVSFGLIPHDHWYQPDSIDEDRARAGRETMQAKKIIYAGTCIVVFSAFPRALRPFNSISQIVFHTVTCVDSTLGYVCYLLFVPWSGQILTPSAYGT